MKFDMHCHTKEGSVDARVSIEDYIKTLREKGFNACEDEKSNAGAREMAARRQLAELVTLEPLRTSWTCLIIFWCSPSGFTTRPVP